MESYGSSQPSNSKFIFDGKYLIPQEIVDDVICRFLLNIPKEEKFDPIRVCFQIELAHWFFVDYYCGEDSAPALAHLRSMPYNQFAYIMFQKTPHLRPRLPEIERHLSAFREYKMRVPTFGAILLNEAMTKVVLVQGFRNHWGFPKGKVNEMEDPVSCAIREVFEETGYDIAPLVNENHYIESKVLERNDRLYIIRGVERNFDFQPQTQFEIKNIEWFNINELPEHKKDNNPAIARHGVPNNNFYSVYSYIRRLKLWIADKQEGRNKIQYFKIRSDNDENQGSSGSSLQKSKSSDHVQKHGKTLIPFQFHFPDQKQTPPIENVPIGWQLYQSASETNHPYTLNSNAIQELILGHSHQHQQQRQHSSNSGGGGNSNSKGGGGGSKGARRRLFSEESQSQTPKQQQQHAKGNNTNQKNAQQNQTRSRTTNANVSGQQPQPQQQQTKSKSNKPTSVIVAGNTKYPILNASAWKNFSFDREKIYKAFFNPPQITP